MAISVADITKLRKMTGAGMVDCKKALTDTNGDFDKAMEEIRKKGLAVAAKRSDRETSEGCVLVKVDGNFAILRSSNINFTVQKSAKGLIGSALGGEGFLQTFEGTGMVWLAPTSPMYNKMAYGGMAGVTMTQGGSHNVG